MNKVKQLANKKNKTFSSLRKHSNLVIQAEFYFSTTKLNNKIKCEKGELQKKMEEQFYRMKFKSLEDWLSMPSFEIALLENEYTSENKNKLSKKRTLQERLLSVYPNFPWNFKSIKLHSIEYFQNRLNKQEFLERLFKHFNLETLEDWKNISRKKIIRNGGYNLLILYSNSKEHLLSSVYPNYSWNFSIVNKNTKISHFQSIENQRHFMDQLFNDLELKSFDEWRKVKKSKLRYYGAYTLLSFYYLNNYEKLLTTIYPNYPWTDLFRENSADLVKKRKLKNVDHYYHDNKELTTKIMNNLFHKLNLNSLDDWLRKKKAFIRKGGNKLLRMYCNNNINSNGYEQLLLSTYPNYSWDFSKFKKRNNDYTLNSMNNINSQSEFMNNMYLKLNLSSLEDWNKISKRKFIKNGGYSLLITHYLNDFKKLLSTVYPNYPWSFNLGQVSKNDNLSSRFKSIDQQIEFMDNLFVKLKLKSLEEWNHRSKQTLYKYGAADLVLYTYSNDFNLLLSSVYPNYPWQFNNRLHRDRHDNQSASIHFEQNEESDVNQRIAIKKRDETDIYSTEYQKAFLDKLFIQLKLNHLNDWLSVSKKKLISCGASFLLSIYKNDISKLLTTLYPYHNWNFRILNFINSMNQNLTFPNLRNNITDHITVDDHELMEYLFYKYKLKSLDDWNLILEKKRSIIVRKYLLPKYKRNRVFLLTHLYPNFPWKYSSSLNLLIIERHRKKMDKLYHDLKLTQITDWLEIPKRLYKQFHLSSLLSHYSNDMKQMLTTLYPNHSFSFMDKLNDDDDGDTRFPKKFFKCLINQQNFMDHLFYSFNLSSFDDWCSVSSKKIITQNGGSSLLSYYQNNRKKLFKSVYPNYPWDLFFSDITSILVQRQLADDVYHRLKFNNLDDWLQVKRFQIINNGGKRLLQYFNYDLIKLLSTIYVNYSWDFRNMKYKTSCQYKEMYINSIKSNLADLQKKLLITKKSDWYRVAKASSKHNLYRSLQYLHPEQRWNHSFFSDRSKKSTQRTLFIYVQRIFKYSFILENYRHPKIVNELFESSLEFDVFVPALNVGFEYQGEQHYHEIASGFNTIDFYLSRDIQKNEVASNYGITVIYIPFWWNKMEETLLTSIRQCMLK